MKLQIGIPIITPPDRAMFAALAKIGALEVLEDG